MELKLILSGVPKGESYWGPQEDKQYIGLLYKPSNENKRFDISLHKNGNGNFAYYNYLVYNVVNDSEGRAGSYFGLTLRLDRYCMDFESIYQSMDMIFRKVILGNYLSVSTGNRLKYNIISFDDKEADNKKIEESLKNMLSAVLNSKDIMSIPSIPASKNRIIFNLHEVNQSEVSSAVGQYGFCSISEEYIGAKESARLKEEFNNGAKSRQNEIDTLKRSIHDSDSKINELENLCMQLKNKSTSSANSVDNSHHSHHHHSSHHDHESQDKGISIVSIVGLILSVITVLILSYGVFSVLPEIDNKVAKVTSSINDKDTSVDDETSSKKISTDQEESLPNAIIDIENYSDTNGFKKGLTYNVTLKKVETISDPSKIDLELDGAQKMKQDGYTYSVLMGNNSDSVVLTFVNTSVSPKQVIKRRVIKSEK